MAYLDSAGSIILDAVLTDTGRTRLAKGDGSFKIAKFALGDDEINYGLYDKTNASGSAYFDLQILQTPILEAFTNNVSSMKTKLISIGRTNLLYLPTMKVNNLLQANSQHSIGAYVVAVDSATELKFSQVTGVIHGESLSRGGAIIRVDQGLDTKEIPPSFTIDSDLVETQYIVEIDNRFAKIIGPAGTVARVSYIDDDSVASYFLSLGTDVEFVTENPEKAVTNNQIIAGPRGTIIQFQLQASLELNTSTFLFEQLGSTTILNTNSVYYIDSTIKITGATTGNSVDIPIRYVKLV